MCVDTHIFICKYTHMHWHLFKNFEKTIKAVDLKYMMNI